MYTYKEVFDFKDSAASDSLFQMKQNTFLFEYIYFTQNILVLFPYKKMFTKRNKYLPNILSGPRMHCIQVY